MKYKVIIWGHKNSHTHSYIHAAYYNAFKKLGYETYWFDNYENVNGFDFNNCIFLTEGQVESNIPINKSSKYILHHAFEKINKYIDNDLEYINLGNYLKWCEDGISPYCKTEIGVYPKDNNGKENTVEKIDDCTFWDKTSKTIYQPWGTNLTPDEIKLENAIKFNQNEQNIYYVGSKHDNSAEIDVFQNVASKNGKNFRLIKGSEAENYEQIRNSYLSLDLRGSWHITCGYLPCRVFKNISYGRITGTNSEHVKNIFGDYVVYDSDPINLYEKLIIAEKETPINNIKDAMQYVKDKHTYFNRINNLLKFI